MFHDTPSFPPSLLVFNPLFLYGFPYLPPTSNECQDLVRGKKNLFSPSDASHKIAIWIINLMDMYSISPLVAMSIFIGVL